MLRSARRAWRARSQRTAHQLLELHRGPIRAECVAVTGQRASAAANHRDVAVRLGLGKPRPDLGLARPAEPAQAVPAVARDATGEDRAGRHAAKDGSRARDRDGAVDVAARHCQARDTLDPVADLVATRVSDLQLIAERLEIWRDGLGVPRRSGECHEYKVLTIDRVSSRNEYYLLTTTNQAWGLRS